MVRIAPADYVFALQVMMPNTGLYEILGIVTDEEKVENFFKEANETAVLRIEVFEMGQIEGPVRIISSLEEFMEFQ